jgi:hypothetical protein
MKALSETEKAYIAGIVDSEGSIMVEHKPNDNFTLRVSIYNNSEDLLTWLADRLERNVVVSNFNTDKGYVPQLMIHLFGKSAKELLGLIQPYLVIKLPLAEVALKFPVEGQGARYSEEQKGLRAWCWMKVLELNNKKGRKKDVAAV